MSQKVPADSFAPSGARPGIDRQTSVFLNDLGLICALGGEGLTVLGNLLDGAAPRPFAGSGYPTFHVDADLPAIPAHLAAYDCRNNRLLLGALNAIETTLNRLMAVYGASRTGVVIGTSTSGIAEGESAIAALARTGTRPATYDYRQQELGGAAEFLARYLGIRGPAFAVSTTCSSSAHALTAARRLLRSGICDVVLCGGADALCQTTLTGFAALNALSKTHCNPFGQSRDGIQIGEGAALFVMSREPARIALLGAGTSTDAHHLTAPDPTGEGAYQAMAAALRDSGLSADQIDYINLHGTGTKQNDAMESRAVHRLFGGRISCGSTKAVTGHCLGAAGAIEAGICWLLLSQWNGKNAIPQHYHCGDNDPELPPLGLVPKGNQSVKPLQYCVSNSFAFGGNNVSLVIGRPRV